MDGTPGRNAGIDQAFAQGVLKALRQQSEAHNAERREEMQLMLRSAMLDRQELQRQMRDAMLLMQEATAEQTRQLREVMAEQKAEKSQQIPAAASPHVGEARHSEQRETLLAMQLQFQQDMKIFMTQQMQEMKHVLLQRVEEHKEATAAAQEQQGQQIQEMQEIQQEFRSDMKCVQHDLQRLLHEPPPNHAKVQQIDQLRTDAQQKFADLLFQVGAVHDSLEGIQASQPLEQLRTELQQVHSRQVTLWNHCARLESDIYTEEEVFSSTEGWLQATDEYEDDQPKSEPLLEQIAALKRTYTALQPELEELRQMQRVHTEQVQAIERAHAEQCAKLRAEHAAQMKQSEAEMQALKASCEEQASTCAAQLQTLEELRKLHSVHTQQMQALETAHAEQLQKLEQRVTEPRGLEQQHQTALEQLGKQVRDLEQQQQADAKKVKALEQQQFAFETRQMAALQRLLEAERLRRHSESLAEDQRHHEQMAALRNQRLRANEKLLSSKELAFDDPPRISPGSFTTPPGFSGGRGGKLMRPSAPWPHSPPRSRTPVFPHEQAKLQDNDPRPSPD